MGVKFKIFIAMLVASLVGITGATTAHALAESPYYARTWNSVYSNRNLSVSLDYPATNIYRMYPGQDPGYSLAFYSSCSGTTDVSVDGGSWIRIAKCKWQQTTPGHDYVVKSRA